VHLVGNIHTEDKTRIDPDGTFRSRTVISFAADGTGLTSGVVYQLTQIQREQLDIGSPLPFSADQILVAKLVGTGVPDQYTHVKMLLHIDVNGVITRNITDVAIKCNP
jgi:hypothetical protein